MKVYLDYAATTPVKKEVLEAMLPFYQENFGNPSSIHSWGRIARAGIDEARETVAKFLGAEPSEIIFTSGATEANNLAIQGLIKSLPDKKPHIITSTIEHHAVLEVCEELVKKGLAEVTFIKPNVDGIIEIKKIKAAIKKNTVLISIMYVNNEIGAIAPIREIGKLLEKENEKREKKIYFHTDAVQAVGHLKVDVKFLHVDLLSFSGHKIYGPKGIGALYIKKGTPIGALIFGGGQEKGLRPGTENVSGIVGLAKAVSLVNLFQTKRIDNLKNYFIDKIQKEIPDVEVNGGIANSAPHIVNLYFKFIEGESIVLSLDLEGVACSTGSACTSQSLTPSHVLMSCYNDHFRAAGSVRFSFGEMTTKKELDIAINKLKAVVKRLRKISPYSHDEKEKNE